MRPEKIFFDLDGVLADFERGVKELAGFDKTAIDNNSKTPVNDDAMWEAMRRVDHFFDKLEPLPEGIRMFRSVKEKYPGIIEVLTGVPKEKRRMVTAAEDKISWAKRVLGEDIPVNLVFKEDKKNLCKGKTYVLIDDRGTSIDEWEAAGGSGILYTEGETDLMASLEQLLYTEGSKCLITEKQNLPVISDL